MPGATPSDSGRRGSYSLEGCTPAKLSSAAMSSSRAYSPPGWNWGECSLSGGNAPGYSKYSLPG